MKTALITELNFPSDGRQPKCKIYNPRIPHKKPI